MTIRLAAIWRYPVKSLGGQEMTEAAIEPRGITHDRRWMVTTPDGRFVTRREAPAMAHCRAVPGADDAGIVLSHRAGGSLAVATPTGRSPVSVRVWGDTASAVDAGDAAAQWLSARMERAVRLVHMPDPSHRAVDPRYGSAGDQVSFADGFPLLVAVTESLDALNRQLAHPAAMAQFRPNLVIEGAPGAFAEDDWHQLTIGGVTLRLVKPCTRCIITTQHPATGAVIDGMEPLRTLRAMGRVMTDDKRREPIFGVNAIPDNAGMVAVGDRVKVIA